MYFKFKGTSTAAYNIVVNSMPTFKKPKKRYDPIEVEGRHGYEVVEDAYDAYILPTKITLMNTSLLDTVIAWLDGSGVLECSDDPGKYRNASIYEEVDYERLEERKQTQVNFLIKDPFRYVLDESNVVITNFVGATITLGGTYYSEPILLIAGTGKVTITLNGTTFDYTFQTGESVTIDCKELQATYNGLERTQYMAGDFPILSVGSNALSVSGNVTSITVTKRTRYL